MKAAKFVRNRLIRGKEKLRQSFVTEVKKGITDNLAM